VALAGGIVTTFGYACQQLTCADVALLKDLLRVFGEAFDEIETYQRSVPSDHYLTELLKKKHFIALVALNGEQVVGGLTAYELDKFEQDRRESRSTFTISLSRRAIDASM
jgi:aminoglycoside 3-N-acetyltransferase I